jgi:hypothetical protein
VFRVKINFRNKLSIFSYNNVLVNRAYPYVFGPNTGKVDMREQRRELRLRFTSDVAGGNYQLGKLVLNAEIGDVRPYGP